MFVCLFWFQCSPCKAGWGVSFVRASAGLLVILFFCWFVVPCYYDGSFEFMNSLFYKWVFFLFVFLVDFSRKRQQKKVSVARTKGTSGKGFVPSKKNTRMKKGDTLTSVVSEIHNLVKTNPNTNTQELCFSYNKKN